MLLFFQKPKIIDYGHSTKLWKGLKFGLCASKMPPCYAPEVCAGDMTTAASDIYTLGVALGTVMEAADLSTEIGQLVEQYVYKAKYIGGPVGGGEVTARGRCKIRPK